MVVLATGMNTEVGSIADLIGSTPPRTPLQIHLDVAGRRPALIASRPSCCTRWSP